MSSTGELLRELRIKKGLTQDEVADSIGISLTSYARYELGLRQPKTEIAIRICNFFGITAEELLKGELAQETAPNDEIMEMRQNLREEIRLLYEIASKSTPEHIRAATAMLQALKGNADD